MHNSFYIGDWLVEPELNRLSRKRQEHALEPRLMRLLVLLAQTPKELVSKDEILDAVWSGLSVTDESLSQAISKLRKLLDDNFEAPVYIETIRKKGYRLVAHVTPVDKKKVNKKIPWKWVMAALLASMGILFYAATNPKNAEIPTLVDFLPSQPVTSSPGRERDPALSEDGSFLVYSKQLDGGDPQIFLHGINRGTGDRQLTNLGANFAPAIMPGSQAAVFLRQNAGNCTVILSSLIDGAERSVGSCQGNSYADTTVSPDGRSVAFSARDQPNGPHAIVIMNIQNGNTEPATKPPLEIWGDYDPVFSSDGQSLFFARSVSEAMQDVYKLDLATGEETRLTHDGRNIMGLTRAGEKILFASNRDGRYALWSIGQNGDLARLPISQTGIINPSATKTGNRLIFEAIERVTALGKVGASEQEGNDSLFQFNAEILHPAANPDFSRLVFSSNRSGFFEIWSAGTNGQGLSRLTDFRAGFTAHPKYSPDGSRIAFDARPDTKARIFIMDIDGRNNNAVTPSDGINRYAPSWTPNGNGLVYARETNGQLELWQLDLDTGGETQLTATGGTFGYLMSDGSLFHTRPNTPGIWHQSPDTAEPRVTLSTVEFSDWGNWTTDGVRIRYFDRKTNSLKSFDSISGSQHNITSIDGYVPTADPAIGFALGEDTALVVTRLRLESDIEYVDIGPPQLR